MDPYSAALIPIQSKSSPMAGESTCPSASVAGERKHPQNAGHPCLVPSATWGTKGRLGKAYSPSAPSPPLLTKPSGRGAPDQKKLYGHKRQGSAIASAELCFQQQPREKENLLCRLTIWDPKGKLQSRFGEGPNAGCYDPMSYWIPFCFLVC